MNNINALTLPKELARWIMKYPQVPRLLKENKEINGDKEKCYEVINKWYGLSHERISVLNKLLCEKETFFAKPLKAIDKHIIELRESNKPPVIWQPPL